MNPASAALSQLSPRPLSRPSSRGSLRATSPSVDDPVYIRNQMSSLKHDIRHKTAQLHSLENTLLRGPRPLPQRTPSPPASPPPSSYNTPASTTKAQRRTSAEVLSAYAAAAGSSESFLPLPVNGRSNGSKPDDIREGIPTEFGISSTSTPSRRAMSPTRTLSRIPVSSVGHARALADDGAGQAVSPIPPIDSAAANSSFSSLIPSNASFLDPPSPGSTSSNPNRKSFGGGGTGKVLADLQAGAAQARNQLEGHKAQLRTAQRQIAQLTRQSEDLKDSRERLRLENESLNNVVARKERLLQELLERARKAESEASQLKGQLKAETANCKKSLREMETALSEATVLSTKSEREYLTLRDSIKGMKESWRADVEKLREEMKAKEEAWKKEAEDIGLKYRSLVKLVQATRTERARIDALKAESKAADLEIEKILRGQLEPLAAAVEQSTSETETASRTVQDVADELARMRRLMRLQGQPLQDQAPPS